MGNSDILSLLAGPHPVRTLRYHSRCCKMFSKFHFGIYVKETLVFNYERPSMNLAMSILLDRFSMFLCSIAFVPEKIILGELAIVDLHDPVSVDFGNDGGRSYRDAPRVAFDNGFLGYGDKNAM